ncbi:HDOD domain-containing protein [Propionivibrio sp.]|jgi:HD-like signal output (HDOD) protein|uniref:HDOD domain-containing protein n=1 Tax=Propionivibrio sp. TaxID=2212460 RepID=UPI0025D39821|nr:HDOD domain-containing protein [Propionivibrio sp.]
MDQGGDKVGEALSSQRFQMLTDIARDLAGDVVFPTCFDTAVHLRQALQNPDVPITQIVRLVSVEPLIAAKLLHLANSVYYNPSGAAVRGLPEAVTRLGVSLVRTTALAVAMNQLMRSREMVVYSDLMRDLWQHSIKTAVAARILARAHTRLNPDEAMLAGLVHDLGAFYMLYRAMQYAELRARPESMRYLIVQWHESIGVTLLNALGLPTEIVDATIDHDQPRPVPTTLRTLADVVYVANLLTSQNFDWLYPESATVSNEITLAVAAYSEILPQVDADAREMMVVFS